MMDPSSDQVSDINTEFDTTLEESDSGTDNEFTKLDEKGYDVLDEENDREVASRGGMANYTQNVDAELPENEDDAEIREGELPIQSNEEEADI